MRPMPFTRRLPCGGSRDRVERVLAQTEPFSRGQFTGVYGYWDYRGNADTALVIRTAQLGQHLRERIRGRWDCQVFGY
ncbi:MAG: chorismate-binding protein [Lawsonibacter sp.]